MKYSKATIVLPQEVLEMVQQYVQGELLYIPKKPCACKKWGDNTQGKAITARRNQQIREGYLSGKSVVQLAEQYHLSLDSIRKIVYRKS